MASFDTPQSCHATAAIAKNRIVKVGSDSGLTYAPSFPAVTQCGTSGKANVPYGVAHEAATAAGDIIPVVKRGGQAYVEAGGTFSQGGMVKSDSNGKAVAAALADGQYIVGMALEDATSGKIVLIEVDPQYISLT